MNRLQVYKQVHVLNAKINILRKKNKKLGGADNIGIERCIPSAMIKKGVIPIERLC